MSAETQQPLGLTVKTSGEIASAASASHAKALIEAKYIMALQRPRNLLAVRDSILAACSRPGFAAAAWYAKPVGNGKVRGPSIRFAETAIQCMTNITIMPSIVYEDREKLVLDVQVLDLENNVSFGDQVTLSKTVERKDKKGREVLSERKNTNGETVYVVLATEDEMANKTNSAKSKIIRNSGLRLVPQDLIEEAEWAVKDTLEKGGSDPLLAMKRMADAFSQIGIKPDELEKYLAHNLDSISPAEIKDLREVYATLKDGEAKWSDYVEGGQRKSSRESVPIPEALRPKTQIVENEPEESLYALALAEKIIGAGFTYPEFHAATGVNPADCSEEEAQRQLDSWAITLETLEAAKKPKGGKAK